MFDNFEPIKNYDELYRFKKLIILVANSAKLIFKHIINHHNSELHSVAFELAFYKMPESKQNTFIRTVHDRLLHKLIIFLRHHIIDAEKKSRPKPDNNNVSRPESLNSTSCEFCAYCNAEDHKAIDCPILKEVSFPMLFLANLTNWNILF